MNKARILLIEDDKELAELTFDYLQNHNLSVNIEHDGADAVARIISEQPDLVILDIMLPNKDGFSICREVRREQGTANSYSGPILMLTARDEDMDQLLGLELGADDYVTKPVQPALLLARIHSLLRRASPAYSQAVSTLTFGELSIDSACREVSLAGKAIDLTTTEFDLLFLLAKYAGAVLSRDDISQHLRGFDYDGSDRTIDLRVSRLRNKLGLESIIKTVRGAGYLFINKEINQGTKR